MVAFVAEAGGGWVHKKRKGYFQLAEWWTVTDMHFTNTGALDPNVTYGLFNTTFYGEYGFTDRITGIVYLPIFSRAYHNNTVSETTGEVIMEGQAINGIGDAELSVKYGLITDKPVVMAVTVTMGIPFGNASGGDMGILQTGDGEFNQMIKLDVSTSKPVNDNVNTYYSLGVGFNHRTRGFSEEFRYNAEFGVIINKKWFVMAKLNGCVSFKNGDPLVSFNTMSVFANNTEYLTFSPGVAYNINEQFGITFNFSRPIYGKILLAGTAYTAGIYLNL